MCIRDSDLGADGIRCNAIAPGWVDTDLSDDYLAAHPDPAAARRALLAMHPVGRTGTARHRLGRLIPGGRTVSRSISVRVRCACLRLRARAGPCRGWAPRRMCWVVYRAAPLNLSVA